MDWSTLYPQYFSNDQQTQKCVEFADVGCGYGGLLGNLSFVLQYYYKIKVSNKLICSYSITDVS